MTPAMHNPPNNISSQMLRHINPRHYSIMIDEENKRNAVVPTETRNLSNATQRPSFHGRTEIRVTRPTRSRVIVITLI